MTTSVHKRKPPKRRHAAAKALGSGAYRQRVVPGKKRRKQDAHEPDPNATDDLLDSMFGDPR